LDLDVSRFRPKTSVRFLFSDLRLRVRPELCVKKNGMRPVPPDEIPNEEFLKPLGLTANALTKAIGVPPNRITAILKDERGITGDTAMRLGTF
jgi:addiction module HigA family antidote